MPAVLRRLAAILVAVGLLFTTPALDAHQRAEAAEPGYLMVHFTGDSATGQQLYLAHSTDGLHWNDLNGGAPILRSTIGTKGVRDPALIRSPDGSRYWIIATDLCVRCGSTYENGSPSLVVWESTDLVTWSEPRLLNVAGAIPDGRNAWAPEAIWNPETNDYVLYWATNATVNGVLKYRIYYARTTDFRTITTPRIWIDPPGTTPVVDTQMTEVPAGAGKYRYIRVSGDGRNSVEGSNSILGTWTDLGTLSSLGLTGNVVEGPVWMKFRDRDEWALYIDYNSPQGVREYRPILTTDPFTVADYRILPPESYDMGGTAKRHGAITTLTAAEESRVLARWPHTPAKRLQSYNYQDRYVRHANFDVRIDPAVSPAEDAQFRPRPGLVGTGTVSFESVNFPGYFLRHANYDFQLVRDDGTAQFAADATFRQVPGLADASWSSFQSYNHPDRYIRHYAYQLRLDPITTATGRSDATFHVTN
ncbi:glycoside hydrolase family 43 protein [Streptomyces sp. VRA16 Mangrove soil]|uniref:glycoside hydrolase family 43 protein n=1 Tax=Streptomyces sp. VRA16 Mangrove soil TaxID=2817434 RepID=UPI001A9DAD69|nr:glycoside hydrolase family 43 protein [Streptomyces sp. VRA16 Mangrove soil]MBO1329810.1 AbfB domain-containing protein [Streptomyces sp. VRA16 Mangrove soil]